MQLYIDTANLNEIKEAISWGIVDGITTNPSLIKKETERLKAQGQQVNFEAHIKEILRAAGPELTVSLEVTATDAQGMINQGKLLYQKFNAVAGNVVVKIPVNTYVGDGFDGLKAIKALEDGEIPVNTTLIFTPEQALLAAQAGATYVSPFAGRVDDYIRAQAEIEFQKNDYFPLEGWETEAEDEDGEEDVLDDNGIVSGVDLVTKIVDLFEKHEIDCNIIAASLRNPRQVRQLALAGADIGTTPFSVLRAMIQHPKTKEGMERFMADVVPEYQSLFGGSVPTPPAQPQQPVQQPAQPQTPPSQPQRQPSAYDLARQQ